MATKASILGLNFHKTRAIFLLIENLETNDLWDNKQLWTKKKKKEYEFLNFPLLVLKHLSSQSECCFPNQICWNKNNNIEQISTFDLDKKMAVKKNIFENFQIVNV